MLAFLIATNLSAQGNLTPPSGSPQPEMKSLQELWDKVETLEQAGAARDQEIAELKSQNAALLQKTGSATWHKTQVSGVGSAVSVAKKPDGTIACAFTASFNLWYGEYVNGTWQVEVADDAVTEFRNPSLAIAPSGNPGISYYDNDNQDLKYAYREGSQWSREYIETSADDIGGSSSLAFSPSGMPSVTYYDQTNGRLRYAFYSDGLDFQLWFVSEVESGVIAYGEGSHSYNHLGQPVVAYYGGPTGVLKYAVMRDGSWEYSIVDDEKDFTGADPSLAFTPTGEPAIAYIETSTGNLKYAQRYLGATWVTHVANSEGLGTGEIDLAFTPGGNPAISHPTAINPRDLYFTEYSHGEWRTHPLYTLGYVGDQAGLVFSDSGEAVILFRNSTWSLISVRRDASGQ